MKALLEPWVLMLTCCTVFRLQEAIKQAKARIAEAEAAAAARPSAKRKAASESPMASPETGGAAAAAALIDEENEVWTKQADIECTDVSSISLWQLGAGVFIDRRDCFRR